MMQSNILLHLSWLALARVQLHTGAAENASLRNRVYLGGHTLAKFNPGGYIHLAETKTTLLADVIQLLTSTEDQIKKQYIWIIACSLDFCRHLFLHAH